MDNMIKNIFSNFRYILICIFLIISQPLVGKTLPVNLIADNISYDKLTGILIATGNVEIIYNDTKLQTSEIRYNNKLDTLSIIGKFTINDGNDIITSNNDTIINKKLKNGLIKGARAILNNKLQLSAQSINQKNNNQNVFETVIASTCKICANNPTPFWQIRANKIIHDKEKQKIYFKNARLDFLGLPVLYVPAINIPEPGISRASGLLVPQFSTSDKVGFSSKIPYYFVIDNNKDFIIYTDGACRNNGKKNMPGGIGIHFSHKNIMKMDDISEKLEIESSTNNIAELMAIKRAMELTKEIYNVKIYTDSTYSINVITKWYDMWIDKGTIGEKKNIDIIKPICDMYKEKKVDLIHVKAHTGNLDEHSIGNMIADRLATESLKQ